MKKAMPLRYYFGRAKVFGYLLVAIFIAILVYLAYSFLR